MFRNQENTTEVDNNRLQVMSTLVEFFTLCITSRFPSISYSQASENRVWKLTFQKISWHALPKVLVVTANFNKFVKFFVKPQQANPLNDSEVSGASKELSAFQVLYFTSYSIIKVCTHLIPFKHICVLIL